MAVITGTNGNDSLTGTPDSDTINALLGKDVVDGLAGLDTLIVDYSAVAVDPYAGATMANVPSIVASSGGSFSGSVKTVDGSNTTTFSGIERLEARLDFFHNSFVLDGAALALGATIALDGGAGTDTLEADFSALGALDLQLGGGGASGNFGSIANFDIFRLKLGAGNDNVTGGSGKDVLAGGGGSDTLDGGGGDDTLHSAELSPAWSRPHLASDIAWTPPVLDTGSEADVLRGGSGYDTIFAGFGDSVDGGADLAELLISLRGSSTGLTLDFRSLADGGTLTIGGALVSNISGVSWIEGSDHDDVLTGSHIFTYQNFGAAPMFGRGGNDRLTAGQATGNIYGGDGNDSIDSYVNNGAYYGEAGDDVITARGSTTHSYGGDGNDRLEVVAYGHGGSGNDIVTVIRGGGSGGSAYGNDGDDQLTGSDDPNALVGGAGADTIHGNNSMDWLFSAGPADSVAQGLMYDGTEYLGEADHGTEHDQVFGGQGYDRLSVGYGDDADGGTDINSLALSLRGSGSGIVLDTADIISGAFYQLGGGTLQNFQSIAVLWGSDFGDVLSFADQSTGVRVYGEGGNDTINATSAADTIRGGSGADIINAGGGDDTIHVDLADDAPAGEQIDGGAGFDTLRTAPMVEVDISAATLIGIESIISGVGAVVSTTSLSSAAFLTGTFRFANGGIVSIAATATNGSLFFSLSPAGNRIDLTNVQASGFLQVYGQGGDDVIIASAVSGGTYYGGGGNDQLTGGGSVDWLYGNEGHDRLDGRGGADQLTGGTGDDLYVLDNSGDRVFESGGEGNDTIESSVTISSINSLNVETLRLTGMDAADATGNSGDNLLIGNGAANVLNGLGGNDFLRLQDGGADTANGGEGNDVLLFGAALTSLDMVNGGSGTDQIAIQGDYAGAEALTVGSNIVSVENLAILPGSDTRFGDPGTNFYSYDITAQDVALAAGVQLVVDANRLRPGEDFTFNGSAESDGSFFIYGGGGNDLLTGGSRNDVFIFGHQGQWGTGDVVTGGAGVDQLALRGNYTITFGANQLVGVEQIGMVSAQDTRYGVLGSTYSYDLIMVDSNVDGIQMTVDAAPLRPGETLTFNGSAEDDGSFRVFGGRGDDSIVAGQNGDILAGNGGADQLTGGAGGDAFRYVAASDSAPGSADRILDFLPGTDWIDLSRIDADTHAAGNQAFRWIGSNAFTGTNAASAGELRAYQSGNSWFVEGDTDGNGAADLVIEVTVLGPTPLGADNFLL